MDEEYDNDEFEDEDWNPNELAIREQSVQLQNHRAEFRRAVIESKHQ